MKCKAKWLAKWDCWRLYCPEDQMYIMNMHPKSLPHDLAVAHAERYHAQKGE